MPAPAHSKPSSSAFDSGAQTAIVNLTSAFAENHPSRHRARDPDPALDISTLHENFPAVEQVRFLVDGQLRETLAGHADLTRTYLAGENEAVQNNEGNIQP